MLYMKIGLHIFFKLVEVSVCCLFFYIIRSRIARSCYCSGQGSLVRPRPWGCRVGLSGWTTATTMAALLLVFKETCILFSIVAAPSYLPNKTAQRVSFFHVITNICYSCSFWGQPFWWVWVVSRCPSDLHFPDDEDRLAPFPDPMLPLHFFFGDKYLFSSSARFKNQVLYCFIVEL